MQLLVVLLKLEKKVSFLHARLKLVLFIKFFFLFIPNERCGGVGEEDCLKLMFISSNFKYGKYFYRNFVASNLRKIPKLHEGKF